jgi:hypothetical protein
MDKVEFIDQKSVYSSIGAIGRASSAGDTSGSVSSPSVTMDEEEVGVDEESSSEVPLENSETELDPDGFKLIHEDRSIKDKINIDNVFVFTFGTSLSAQVYQ